MSVTETERVVSGIWKQESARLVGSLTRLVRDVSLAEEFAQDALVRALEEWPKSGVPERPGAWLMTAAKNRALNALRHRRLTEDKRADVVSTFGSDVALSQVESALEAGMDEDLGEDVLRLVFTACHPLLSNDARVALTLRLVGGLSTDEIARAFLAAESTIAQRIVRAKKTLAEAHVPFEVPRGEELGPRLASVLEVVYLIFNEGYVATRGDDVMRPALQEEALRLARLLAELAPNEPEVSGLLALLELQAARARARVDEAGEPVLLADQDRGLWDAAGIQRGLTALDRSAVADAPAGPYRLQAELAACHARATSIDTTDWARIAVLYEALAELRPSPVVELNRALAVARAEGPRAGLVLLDALADEPALARYHLLPSARADLLERLGDFAAARAEFERAASLTDNARQRERLLARARAAGSS